MPISTDVIDSGLSYLDTNADKIYICSALPTTYTEAITTYALGNNNFGSAGAAIGSPAAATTPTGRKVSTTTVSTGSVTATGTAAYWAVVASASTKLLAAGPLSAGVAVTNGQTFTLSSFAIQIPSGA